MNFFIVRGSRFCTKVLWRKCSEGVQGVQDNTMALNRTPTALVYREAPYNLTLNTIKDSKFHFKFLIKNYS